MWPGYSAHSSCLLYIMELWMTTSDEFPLKPMIKAEEMLPSAECSWVYGSSQQLFHFFGLLGHSSKPGCKSTPSLFPWDVDICWLSASGCMNWAWNGHSHRQNRLSFTVFPLACKLLLSCRMYISRLCLSGKMQLLPWVRRLAFLSTSLSIYVVEGRDAQLLAATASYHWKHLHCTRLLVTDIAGFAF